MYQVKLKEGLFKNYIKVYDEGLLVDKVSYSKDVLELLEMTTPYQLLKLIVLKNKGKWEREQCQEYLVKIKRIIELINEILIINN